MRNFITVLLLTLILITTCSNLNIILYAVDPMDPLNSVEEVNIGNQDNSISENNAFEPVVPGEDSVITETDSNEESNSSNTSDIEKESVIKSGVVFMDTVMYVLGALCVAIPLCVIGIYALASTVPSIFDPVLNFVTFGKIHYQDISPARVMTRCLPIIAFGLLLAGGTFKYLLGRLWYLVGNLIY